MVDPDDVQKKRAEKLAQKGYSLLAEGDYDGALEIAAQVEALCYSAAFEIAAQAYQGKDDPEAAIRELERGLELAPTVWSNWQLLGNYRSDLHRWEKAEEAYRRALDCPDVWIESVRLNQAVLTNRRGNPGESIEILEKIEDPDLHLFVDRARMSALESLGETEKAEALAVRALETPGDEPEYRQALGYIAARLGRIRLERGEERGQIRRFVFDAIEKYPEEDTHLLALVRDIDDLYSETAQYFHLIVQGKIPEASPSREEAEGFYVNYHVVADDPEEALDFIREFEDEEVREHLSINEAEVLEPRPEDPKGVYWRGGHVYYDEEDGE